MLHLWKVDIQWNITAFTKQIQDILYKIELLKVVSKRVHFGSGLGGGVRRPAENNSNKGNRQQQQHQQQM
jgi:hypothetical protein